jgi:endonuclease/exonuclease/phosphatase family metal-dependent hydrolase
VRSTLTRTGFAIRSYLIFFQSVAACLVAAYGSEVPDSASGRGIRIATYNVENYLPMARRINGQLRTNAGKPETQKEAVVQIIGSIHPDVLGLIEIGDPGQFADLQRRLRKAGIDLPHVEYLQAADTTRHLALISRYPITEHNSQNDIPLRVNGMTLHSPRGILDVTVERAPGERIRILCVHLKAKMEVAEYDQAGLREAEAEYLRRYVRDILRSDPATGLVLMGDFNDTKNGKAIRQITGNPEWPDSLKALPLADDRGEVWTEYWSAADVYSRIDYIMVSKKLESQIDSSQSGIARPSCWNDASDHCPLFLSLKKPSSAKPTKATP